MDQKARCPGKIYKHPSKGITMKRSIHDYEKRLESAINHLRKSNISEANKRTILDFKDECFSNGLSNARVIKYIWNLQKMAEWLRKDFEQATLEDIKSLVLRIDKSSCVEFTKNEHKMILRKLYRWLRQSEDYPPEVSWIRRFRKDTKRVKLPEELLTEEEVQAMARASTNIRDRALVSMLYESGCRIGELFLLKVKHISHDQYGAQIVVDGKTGPRRIRIVSSVPYLLEWLNKHPDPENPEAFIWITSKGKLLSYSQARQVILNLGKKAGIRKKIHPHLSRHSRATYLANHLTEAQMKEVFGWIQGSEMAAIYVHLSGRDVDNALLRVYGIDNKEGPKESTLKPKECERCGQKNASSNVFCGRCSYPLDEVKRLEIMKNDMKRQNADNILDELIKDRQFRELLIKKIQGLQSARP